jgi:hypothetical protein
VDRRFRVHLRAADGIEPGVAGAAVVVMALVMMEDVLVVAFGVHWRLPDGRRSAARSSTRVRTDESYTRKRP